MSLPTRQAINGFTLLEVLVAVTVLSIGILGLAGLQVRSLTAGQGTLQSSTAVMLAYAYADLMRANADQARAGAYQISATTHPTATSACTSTAAAAPTAAACTPANMALQDQYTFYNLVNTTLPSGNVLVACRDTTNCSTSPVQTVSVFWDQSRTGATGLGGCGPSPTLSDMACVQVSLQP